MKLKRDSKNDAKYNGRFLIWEKEIPALMASHDKEVTWQVECEEDVVFDRVSIVNAICSQKSTYCKFNDSYFLSISYNDLIKIEKDLTFSEALDNQLEDNDMLWYPSDFRAGAEWAKNFLTSKLKKI